jgi:hypothetical protein
LRAVVLVLVALSQAPPHPTSRRELLVVFGADDPALQSSIGDAALGLGSWRIGPPRLVSAGSATREDLSRGALALVGTPSANPWLAELLPGAASREGLRLGDERFGERFDSISLRSRNPLNPDAPFFLVAGNSDEAVLDALRKRRRADVHVRRRGKTVLLGRLGAGAALEPGSVRRFALESAPGLSTERFDFFVHGFTEARLAAFAEEIEGSFRRIDDVFGKDSRKIAVHLYPTLEQKGLVTDDTRVAHVEEDDVHAVLGVDETPSRLLAERRLDLPEGWLRRGLATALVSGESELDLLARTTERLLRTSSPPRLDSLDGESPHVVEAVAASFASFALKARGPGWFASQEPPFASLESAFRESLARIAVAPSSVPSPPSSFLRGFTYAHEGYNIDDGYLSERSERSLERLRELGIDAVAIVPYTFMRNPREIVPLRVPERPGSETDEDVARAIAVAKAKGMSVLLKPQIWIRGSWPGEIETSTDEDEELFFREYGRWIRHYALLAEKHGVEILAIGTELSKMTLGRRARWETIVGDVRAIYGGQLVYAANWGAEVEHVDFWPLLDYIGVDFYYPLSGEDAPSDEELRRGFERALDSVEAISRRHGRKVLLTEIGYASTKGPWKSPHSSDERKEPSLEDQARAYEVAFAALEDETDWIRGTFWWKWPTDLDDGGEDHAGFTPSGKPAEDVVRRWYRERLRVDSLPQPP